MVLKIILVLLLATSFTERIYSERDLNNTEYSSISNQEGMVRLVGGRTLFEGNVEINHFNRWGTICDDEWDINDADVVCKQLGFVLGAVKATSNSRYGQSKKLIWMDNVLCNGTESSLSKCLFDGWQLHDCELNEAAGVICRIHLNQIPERRNVINSLNQPQKQKNNKSKENMFRNKIQVRLNGDSNRGNVEIFMKNRWKNICADGWSINEAQVVCHQLNLGFAESIFSVSLYPGKHFLSIFSGIQCKGYEKNLDQCYIVENNFCPDNNIAGISCVANLPDLVPNASEIEHSSFIEDRSIMFLQCALEENCLSKTAYEIDKNDPNWIYETRRLLRFTANIKNIGKIDFRPFKEKSKWIWHSCHRHYHSMEVFATFDILDHNRKRVAQGHKASFCLEDNECFSDKKGKFVCANYGDQGISVNCVDIYKYDLDCQWIDITDIEHGSYQLKVIINPEMKVPEITYANNAVLCQFEYWENYALVTNCTLTFP